MKVQFRVNPDMMVEIEAENIKTLFEKVGGISEIFGSEKCGKCNGDSRCAVRKQDKYVFYEKHCMNAKCGHRLSFGAHQEGNTLFPKRKNEDGTWKQNNGWEKWSKDKK